MESLDTILRVGRAVDALRRGSGVRILNDGNAWVLFATEFLDAPLFDRIKAGATLLFTRIRAESLGLVASTPAVSVTASNLSFAQTKSIADPTLPTETLPKLTLVPADELLVQLVKYASLLPSVLIVPAREEDSALPALALADLRAYAAAPLPPIIETAGASLPIQGAEHCRITSYRAAYATSTHLLLTVGDPANVRAPLTRVHSSCITGDILGSLRCDCGDQLKLALDTIKTEGAGLLIYLHQEGRGIGITNKLRAYKLQEMGVDTYEANRLLGYDEDERDFAIAAAIFKKAGHGAVRLLTNNPAKLAKLAAHGITVTERVPLIAPASAHSHAYIEAKGKKAGHLF